MWRLSRFNTLLLIHFNVMEAIMGLLQGLESLLGGDDAQRFAGGQGNFQTANSPDQQKLQSALSQLTPQQSQQVFSQAAQQMDPQQYAQHITPGVNGTNPLGALGSGGLSTIASLLLQHLGGTGGNAAGLLSKIPGLQTTDPSQMDAHQVASLAQYTQQNHPDIFGNVAAQLGQQQPGLLHSFLGQAGLALGTAALASRFIKVGNA